MAKKPTIFEPIGEDKSFNDLVDKVLGGGKRMDNDFNEVDIDNILNDSNNEVIPIFNFDYEGKEVRTIYRDGEIWFVAKDVCDILGLTHITETLKNIELDDCSTTALMDSLGRLQDMRIVNESGMYQLIFQSRKPEAKKFTRWVTKEVLPSIRKTGKYEVSGTGNLSENEKRKIIREQVIEHNKILVKEAGRIGVGNTDNKKDKQKEFAIFHSFGYRGLYGGLTAKTLHKKRNLKKSDKILDHMGSTELAANLFRITQAEEKLKQEEDNVGKDKANSIHYLAGQKVREAMLAIHGIAPENLPVYDKIKLDKKENKQISNTKEIEFKKIEIDIATELWKIALLIMAQKYNGNILTKELMIEIPKYIDIPKKYKEISTTKNEPKFKQVIRNLKSNTKNKTNFVNQGYAILVKGGFQITPKGIEFVKEYFNQYL